MKRLMRFLVVAVLFPAFALAQTTTSSISGTAKAFGGEPLVGATITATHLPTGTVYRTQSKTSGNFYISNMNPGGPYLLEVSFQGFLTSKRDDIYLGLGEVSKQDVVLATKATELSEVVVSAVRGPNKTGVENNLSRDKVANLPTVGRNISDLLRSVPQARLTGTEGAIAIAGQNNRYNAFYIDGSLNNDVFGLAASGTNGGQANIPPISLDAIDQIQVSISPYDASLSGFTGGGINAVTRSGTNKITGSLYYLYRNEKLAGKTPTGSKDVATRFPAFEDKTYGFRVGGPIIKNKLFYFVNTEFVRFERPQVFDTSRYNGNTKGAALAAIADTLRKRYGYEPGGFMSNPEQVKADRVVVKVDWNVNEKNKLSFSYRFNKGERYNTSSSSTSTINFYNNGYIFPTKTSTFTGELRSTFKRGVSNKLLLTFADVKDDRGPLGSPFPRVSITDGSGRIIFGPDNSSTINLLTQKNYNLVDIVRFNFGKHSIQLGTDNELNDVYNAFIQNTYGNYTYNNLADFYNNAKPASYSVGYPLIDNKTDETTAAAAKFKTMRLSAFFNDEYRANENLTVNVGLRLDYFTFITKPGTDSFTNNVAIPKFSQYYDLQGARSGMRPNIPVMFSPRIGMTYKIPEEKVTIRLGAGLFTGRIPLVWPAGIYNSNGINQGGFTVSGTATALNTIRFKSDPFNQWKATDVGITLSKGPLNLIAKDFKLPKVFRASFGFEKQLGSGWTTSMEGLFTKNINDIYYTNINILPATAMSLGAGSRSVYPFSGGNANIPLTVAGTNPYDNAVLLSNAKSDKGFSYNLTGTIDKRMSKGWSFNLSYSYGESFVLHEQTSSVNYSQWRFIETVNGRNNITRSTSDFSPGHRIVGFLSKKFEYLNKAMATTVSLFYTGQQGSPISYVYQQGTSSNPGPVRDDPSGGNDLIYVPTANELQNMTFLSNTVGSTTYTAQQQKDALENYIQGNKYLRGRRGQFAERNGDRLPFTNLIDIKVAQDFNVKIAGHRYQFQVTYDMFNFTNFLNRDWGRTYFTSNDNVQLINFAGYVNATTNLTPQYRFNPALAQPQSQNFISTTSAPSFAARWTSQLGLRFNF